jgi:hypothetical protein
MLSKSNGLCGFFDEILVVFAPKDISIEEMVAEVAKDFPAKD